MCGAGAQPHANSLLVSNATFKPKPGACGKNLPSHRRVISGSPRPTSKMVFEMCR
jgi:hypothetical protein